MKKIVVASLLLVTSGCASVDDGMDVFQGMTTGQLIGTVAGAYVEGTVGAEVGGGPVQLLATTLGVVVGANGGYAVGSILAPSDYAYYDGSARESLSAQKDGVSSHWSNPETGNSGMFRATRSFPTGDGRYCRDYRAVLAVAGKIENQAGTACLQTDGTWRIADDELG